MKLSKNEIFKEDFKKEKEKVIIFDEQTSSLEEGWEYGDQLAKLYWVPYI